MRSFTFLSLFFVLVCCNMVFAQLDIQCNSPGCGTVIPNSTSPYSYVASNTTFTSCSANGGFSSCHFKWEVTNGVITNNNNQTTYEGDGYGAILVNWSNVNGNGKVKVTVSNSANCSSCGSGSKEITLPISYMGTAGGFQVNGSDLLSPYKIGCGTGLITIRINPVTGADYYTWTLPPGWGGSANIHQIQATPTQTSGGLLKVRARKYGSNQETVTQVNVIRPVAGEGISAISGADVICSGSSSYSLSFVPPSGTTLSWTKSGSSISIPAGITASSISATYSYSGKTTLTANIADACGNASRTKDIQAGVYSTSQFSVTGPNQTCPYPDESEVYVSLNIPTAPSPISGYTWTKSSNWPFGYSPSQYDYKLTPPSAGFGNAWVKLSIQNVCGWSIPYQKDISESSGCSGFFAVSPNPANSSLAIIFSETVLTKGVPETIELFDEDTGKLVKSITESEKILKDGNKLAIDVASLKRGTYFLHVTDSKFVGTKTKKTRVILY